MRKKLMTSLQQPKLSHLSYLIAGWRSFTAADGQREWFSVPNEGNVKTLEMAISYLLARDAQRRAGDIPPALARMILQKHLPY